jgi:hypothetical protein
VAWDVERGERYPVGVFRSGLSKPLLFRFGFIIFTNNVVYIIRILTYTESVLKLNLKDVLRFVIYKNIKL